MARILITLSETEEGPAIWADCDERGWNGFHVPTMTAEAFIGYWRALAANDRNGEYPMPFVADDDTLHLPALDAPEDRGEDTTWRVVGFTGDAAVYDIDGLTWQSADPEWATVVN